MVQKVILMQVRYKTSRGTMHLKCQYKLYNKTATIKRERSNNRQALITVEELRIFTSKFPLLNANQ